MSRREPFVIPAHEIASLTALIMLLEARAPLTPEVAWRKQKQAKRRIKRGEDFDLWKRDFEKMQAKTPFVPRIKDHPIHGNTDHALGYQVAGLNGHFEDWFSWAHFIPPHPANRIKAILKRAKLLELRDRFIAAYDKHIPEPVYFDHPWPLPEDEDEKALYFYQSRVPRLVIRLISSEETGEPGKVRMEFDFCCKECGGADISFPDDDDEEGPAICKACGIVYGTLEDVHALARQIGKMSIKA